MQRIYATMLALVVASFGVAQWAAAEQSADSRGVPVEFFACTWQDGKDMGDLDRVLKKFNQWADERDADYAAWLLTPQFQDNVEFDVGWLGSWPNANDFGRQQDAWVNEGGEVAAAFNEVVDCSHVHQMATSIPVSAPDGPPKNGVVLFSSCTMQAGVSPADALPAHREVSAAMRGMGSKAMSWVFYPSLGVSEPDLDYWSVIAFNNYTEMGAAMELWTNSGGWMKAGSILGKVSDCASPSVFDTKLVRAGSGR